MSELEDPKNPKKSIPDLRAIQSNVVPIDDGKKKRTPGEKIKMRDIHHSVVLAMLGKNPVWPPFPATLHQWLDPVGEATTYIENDGVIRPISDAGIERIIAHYWQKTLRDSLRPIDLGALSADDAVKTRKLWMVSAPGRTQPFPLLVWKSDPRPAHHRMAFDPLEVSYYDFEKAAPCFYEFMTRTTNHEAFMAWIGSLFDELSQRQQYVWLYGEGMNGKSAVMRAIGNSMGAAVMSQKTPQFGDKFWAYSMLHKRLVYFPDCNNASFVTTGDFKELTGEDPVRLEDKYKRPFSAQLPSKFLFISNAKPRISSIKADLRRVIYCGVGDIPADKMMGTDYEDLLRAEIPAFLSICWERYRTLSDGKPRKMFDTDKDLTQAITEDTEHEFEAFVDGHLNVVPYNPSLPENSQSWVRARDVYEMMGKFGLKSNYERQKCKEYMARRHGIFSKKIYHEGKSILVYVNCEKLAWVDTERRSDASK